jgi:hypothetical protein
MTIDAVNGQFERYYPEPSVGASVMALESLTSTDTEKMSSENRAGALSYFYDQLDSLKTMPRKGTLSKIRFILSSYKPFLECEQAAAAYGPLLQNLLGDLLWLAYQDDTSAADVMACIESHPPYSPNASSPSPSHLPTTLSTGVACDILQRICDRGFYTQKNALTIPSKLLLLLKTSLFAAIYMDHESVVGVRQQITNIKKEEATSNCFDNGVDTTTFYTSQTYFQQLAAVTEQLALQEKQLYLAMAQLNKMQVRFNCGTRGLYCGSRGLYCRARGLYCGSRGFCCGSRGLCCGSRGLYCGSMASTLDTAVAERVIINHPSIISVSPAFSPTFSPTFSPSQLREHEVASYTFPVHTVVRRLEGMDALEISELLPSLAQMDALLDYLAHDKEALARLLALLSKGPPLEDGTEVRCGSTEVPIRSIHRAIQRFIHTCTMLLCMLTTAFFAHNYYCVLCS